MTRLILTIVLSLFICHPVLALEKSWHAAAQGKSVIISDFFVLSSTRPFEKNHLLSSLTFDYQHSPLTVTRLGIRFDSLPHLMIFEPSFSFAFSEKIAVGLKVPVALMDGFLRIGATTPGSFKVGVGDIELAGRYIVSPRKNFMPGFALEPFIFIPTGTGFFYQNHNDFSGGLKLISDWSFSENWILGLNVAVARRPSVTYGDSTWGSDMTAGLALGTSPENSFSFCVESWVQSPLSDFFQSTQTIALNTLATATLKVKEAWKFHLSAGSGFLAPIATPIYRAMTGVSYEWGFPKKIPPPVVVPEPIVEVLPPPIVETPPVKKTTPPTTRRFLPIR